MKPISRLNAAKAVSEFDQQEAALVELVKEWLKFEENQQRFDELIFKCGNDSEFRKKLFAARYPNTDDLICVFAFHGMNQLLSKLLAKWIARFDEDDADSPQKEPAE